ncbi:hypothetical protein DBL03_05575 [Pseudomonas putida]|nr:hypothetical protein DBL03_05575 [Pseudomonas putida]
MQTGTPMILYKYMKATTLIASLEKQTVRFTNPRNFNDPFDCEISCSGSSDSKIEEIFWKELKTGIYVQQVGVLSLSRTKSNLLMWAHYADEHKGAIIGIDTEIAGLECPTQNIIPASQGAVIYTSLRPSTNGHILEPNLKDISPALREKLFLHKSIHWAYEEEVRVVRALKDHNPTSYDDDAEPLEFEDLRIPKEAIKQICFGARFNGFGPLTMLDYVRSFPAASVSRYDLDKNTWSLEETQLTRDLNFD